jgi:hypothetical protein
VKDFVTHLAKTFNIQIFSIAKLLDLTIGFLNIDKKGTMNPHQRHKGVLHH